MLKFFPIFKRIGAHLVEKRTYEKKIIHSQGLSTLNMQFLKSLCQALNMLTLQLMRNISPKKNDNPNYYASLVIFQTHKNAILKSIH